MRNEHELPPIFAPLLERGALALLGAPTKLLYPIRSFAHNLPKILRSPQNAVTPCSRVSVRDDPSIPSTGSPASPPAPIKTVTKEAQMVRERYQGLVVVIIRSFLPISRWLRRGAAVGRPEGPSQRQR